MAAAWASAPHAQPSEPAADAARPAPAVAGAVDLVADSRSAKLSFTLSQEVKAKAFLLERPDRVIIDLPEVNFQLPEGAGRRGAGIVGSFRYGLFAPGRSRIVIDLDEPALVVSAQSVSRPGELTKLEVDLTRTDRARYRQAALKPMIDVGDGLPRAAAAPKPVAPADAQKPLIVIDPGHGGVDTGAVNAAGIVEKNIVFAFALKLKEHLEATGHYRVGLTRDKDVFITLPDRVRVAQDQKASLFISIHADILNRRPNVRGATVYTGSKFATDAESAQLADKENEADKIAGVDAPDEPEAVADILQDLTMRETRSFSGQFAKRLVTELGTAVELNRNPHRSAGFRVLKAPDIPSVLIEIGYLSSSKDADLMNSDTWRDHTTKALTAAVDQYFAARGHTPVRAAVSP
ncbi:N-acetylmuramoyl-L-alanine amidase [Chelatococcus reniformis]|uniref:N-acetylmuramoyl-L-alanine amidase n=1 Tax=Chelatococcus reniformis TaxID=1494448 RepID=UPI001FCE3BDD|nr:N-acetylmuramoyl-L-alanine amidase [Chelatococcus reniformis]